MDTNKIKALISYAGKSQAEVAREIGLKPQNFSNKMSRNSFSTEELQKIAKVCGGKYHEYFETPDGLRI